MTVIVKKASKLTDEVRQKIEEALALDCTIEEVCFYANISKQSYYNWINSDDELKERFDELRNNPVLLARQEVIKGLKDNPEFSLKYLERKKKAEFSTRSEQALEHSGTVSLTDLYSGVDEDEE